MAEAWRSKPFPQTVACQICTLELTIPSPEVIPFLSCEACGATPCARLCGRWFASEQGAAKHTLSCGRMAARKPKPPASPPRQASTLPVHGCWKVPLPRRRRPSSRRPCRARATPPSRARRRRAPRGTVVVNGSPGVPGRRRRSPRRRARRPSPRRGRRSA